MRNSLHIGVDFGGSSVKFGVCTQEKVVQKGEPILTKEYSARDALLEEMIRRIELLRESSAEIRGVGVGVPGMVDFERGVIRELNNVPGWNGFPLRKVLEERLSLPVFVDNDCNAIALAEWKLGAAKGYRHVVVIALGTGVGAGLVFDNRLYRGGQSTAGEIGQMSIDYRGVPGYQGVLGTLESFIGLSAIEKYMEESLAEKVSPENLCLLAQEGNATAQKIWNHLAECLATAIANILWLLNPECVVLAGGISQSEEVLFRPLSQKLKSVLSPQLFDHLVLLPAHFGIDAGIMGSSLLVERTR